MPSTPNHTKYACSCLVSALLGHHHHEEDVPIEILEILREYLAPEEEPGQFDPSDEPGPVTGEFEEWVTHRDYPRDVTRAEVEEMPPDAYSAYVNSCYFNDILPLRPT